MAFMEGYQAPETLEHCIVEQHELGLVLVWLEKMDLEGRRAG
jgi:hypothetical protein